MPRSARHLVLAALGAALLAPTAAQAAVPVTSAKVVQCTRGQTAEQRQATFRAGMAKLPGAPRMAVRFTLEESVAGARFAAVTAPGLGVWRKSRSGVRAFAYRQRVKALAEGSAYRVKVSYRWLRRDGSVARSAHRRSRVCRQTDPLPNLRVTRIGGRAAEAPGRVRYAISVSNRGAAPAPASRVLLWVNGAVAGRVAVPPLAAGQVTRVFVTGPRCGTGVGAQADTDLVVRESDETDNVRSASCPAVQ
jgi:hypothetical protein